MRHPESTSVVRFGSFEVDLQSGQLRKHGVRIKLQQQPFQILNMLLERPGELVTREEICRKLWPSDTYVEFEHGLNAAMTRLRQALGDSADNPRFVETLARRGYRFIASVESTRLQRAREGFRPLTARTWMWAAVGLFGILVAGYGIWRIRKPETALLTVTPLTSYPGNELHPALSPDGNQVAFAWDEGRFHNYDIYVKVIGSEKTVRLTSDPADDLSPAWSPDGRSIAFLRFFSNERAGVFLAPALGGAERKIAEVLIGRFRGFERTVGSCVTWSPDGAWIATSDRGNPGSPIGLVLISAVTGEKRKVTFPPSTADADRSPSYSPDGRYLTFVRHHSPVVADVYVLELSRDPRAKADAKRLTFWNRLAGNPVWTGDGQEILFVGDESERGRRIWRIPAFHRTKPVPLNQAGEDSFSLAFSARKNRLVYSKVTADTNIWRIDLFPAAARTAEHPSASASRLIATTRQENNPQYSPDGKRVAYQSESSGNCEIWVANSDGSSARQLTRLKAKVSGYPRWSPDGQRIAFHSRPTGYANIFVIHVETDAYRQLTTGTAEDAAPSWSRDGKWIYFSSNRSNGMQVWRIPAEGGEATQVTKNGGFAAFESVDGKLLVYSKLNEPGLWMLPLGEDRESQILSSLSGVDTFAVTKRGIYFMADAESGPKTASLKFIDFASRHIRHLANIKAPIDVGLTVSPDESSILYTQIDQSGADLILVENFR